MRKPISRRVAYVALVVYSGLLAVRERSPRYGAVGSVWVPTQALTLPTRRDGS
jgi:hypothetical protein